MNEPPRRFEYATVEAYRQAWYLWRAIQRDSRLTDAELDAKFGVLYEAAERDTT